MSQPPFEETRRLAAIVESSDDSIVGKDLDGVVTSWNRAAERTFGYTAAEVIGKSIRLVIPADRQSEEDEVLSRIRRGDRVEHFETVRQRKDGTLIPVSLTVSPILDANGRVVGASKIARDISDRLRAEAERERLTAAVHEANRVKDQFLATLSHELRTPLNAILGYARMMRLDVLPPEKQSRAVETIERNATSLSQIVEDVLDVSRIVSGKMRLCPQPTDVSIVLTDAIEALRPAADAKGIRIEAELDSDVPLVSADPDRLQQVIWNLMSNAVKFTGRQGRVVVSLEREPSQIRIRVKDTGVGIPGEFLPYVFDRFRQAESGSNRERGGLGLGLSIARELIELHGGTIRAESDGADKGSTFTLTLPTENTVVPRTQPVGPSSKLAIDVAPREATDLSGLRVLVVDDDVDALGLVCEILENAGAEVIAAGSGVQALVALGRVHPDVLVSDIGMPRMDGFELMSRIRQATDPAIRNLPAAALTAYARSEDSARVRQSGFQLHLAKPIDPRALMAAIASLAGRTSVAPFDSGNHLGP